MCRLAVGFHGFGTDVCTENHAATGTLSESCCPVSCRSGRLPSTCCKMSSIVTMPMKSSCEENTGPQSARSRRIIVNASSSASCCRTAFTRLIGCASTPMAVKGLALVYSQDLLRQCYSRFETIRHRDEETQFARCRELPAYLGECPPTRDGKPLNAHDISDRRLIETPKQRRPFFESRSDLPHERTDNRNDNTCCVCRHKNPQEAVGHDYGGKHLVGSAQRLNGLLKWCMSLRSSRNPQKSPDVRRMLSVRGVRGTEKTVRKSVAQPAVR